MPLRIASLGSSFAAGPAIQPEEDHSAGRSALNYAHIVASRVGGRLTDLSVCGATLLHLLDTPQYAGGRRFAPQIEDLPPDCDVVLVLGGGNDIGYIGGIFQDTLSRSFLGSLLLYLRGADAAALLQLDVDGLAERYATVLDAIHNKAPEAYVLVVEYQAVLGPDTRAGEDVVFDADRIAHHREVAGRLLEATHKAVLGREEWCSTVNVADRSEAHAIGAEDPWINGFTWKLFREGDAYHPKREGMYAIADLVYDKMLQLGLVDQDQASRGEDTEDGFVLL
ncbi:SGNH hydrolase-type esterase domain-containing protein [Xylaria bambusicola]|uniref:SGNH hydrolase-type esterase domain-containing protein n=1 Tax=Xylaria bambusicola TaxID=326684 RepID=UPI0020079766|nr:SGNH hydrolase-type esterase domain-containing protein [Xylaria bambusicola]KAI0514859.1 SGNH hydrolase-type esterase domain-containing protein [Xylaria bambusicola]